MKTELKIFENNEIRLFTDNDVTYFVGKDVCKLLGYKNETDAMNRHCKGVVKRYPLETSGGVQELRVLQEPDVMRLICGSKLPAAVRFERWVFEEVLPSIRRTGAYVSVKEGESLEELTLKVVKALQEAVDRQKGIISRQELLIEAQAPKVEYHDQVINAVNLHTTKVIAASLGVSAIKLNKFLVYNNWIYKQGGVYYPTNKIMNKGYHGYRIYTVVDSETGVSETKDHLKWTEKGREAIIKLWRSNNK